jgi:hypothetical protein
LEVADPEHQVGDGGGAGADLDAPELVRIDRQPEPLEGGLGLAEAPERVQDFPFQPLQVLQGDVQEVPRAARGVEDRGVAERAEEVADLIAGLGQLPLTVDPIV